MSEMNDNDKNFIANEYRSVTVTRDMEAVWRDAFANFGWKLGKREPAIVKPVWGPFRVMLAPLALIPGSPCLKMITSHKSETKVELKFKRDRELLKKSELNQLQSRFEACAADISSLEEAKKSTATAVAYSVGLIGTVFMGISVFSFLGGMLPICIMAAIPGFAGWVLAYYIYRVVKGRKTRKVTPFIEKKYDMIYEICGKANTILHTAKPV